MGWPNAYGNAIPPLDPSDVLQEAYQRITGGRISGGVGLSELQCFHGYNFGKGDPKGPAPKDDSLRVFRAGCWRNEPIYCRSASRYRGGQAGGGVTLASASRLPCGKRGTSRAFSCTGRRNLLCWL